ncbi:hypothetical protein DVH21_15665 [Micromonospora aurantiaca]|uniref:Uncharacterized protein n=1 Tax=Micromonospora aurantiaca (nom. illeg.) TaxID=47850 RepID=A0A6N3K2A1_9ACTN|nr:hypothetical protein DVH21_15665 [Micromonospora aurantiaca]
MRAAHLCSAPRRSGPDVRRRPPGATSARSPSGGRPRRRGRRRQHRRGRGTRPRTGPARSCTGVAPAARAATAGSTETRGPSRRPGSAAPPADRPDGQ